MDYLRDSGAELGDGHTMQAGDDAYLAFRAPTEPEYWLESPGEMLVIKRVGADEMNEPPEDMSDD